MRFIIHGGKNGAILVNQNPAAAMRRPDNRADLVPFAEFAQRIENELLNARQIDGEIISGGERRIRKRQDLDGCTILGCDHNLDIGFPEIKDSNPVCWFSHERESCFSNPPLASCFQSESATNIRYCRYCNQDRSPDCKRQELAET